MAFTFEKLIVYQKAISFADSVCALTEQFPRGGDASGRRHNGNSQGGGRGKGGLMEISTINGQCWMPRVFGHWPLVTGRACLRQLPVPTACSIRAVGVGVVASRSFRYPRSSGPAGVKPDHGWCGYAATTLRRSLRPCVWQLKPECPQYHISKPDHGIRDDAATLRK